MTERLFQIVSELVDLIHASRLMDTSCQLMIIYNSTWSILIQWSRFIFSGDNLTYVNTKESVLPVGDKHYRMNKQKL